MRGERRGGEVVVRVAVGHDEATAARHSGEVRLGEGADASHLVSYQLVCRHARQAIREHMDSAAQGVTAPAMYQLEIRLERPDPQGLVSSDTVLRSPLLP